MAETPKFELPAIVRERLQAASAGTPQLHPEPDMLAAFSERALPQAEREQVLSHLAACDHCREVLALIAPEEGPPRVAAHSVVERAGFSWRTLRWGAMAAVIALVAVLTIPRLEQVKSPQTAAVHPFSEDVPPQPQTKPAQNENRPQAANSADTATRLSGAESAPAKEPAASASRLDHFKAEAKSATSANGPALFDRDLGKSKVLTNGATAAENANLAQTETGAGAYRAGGGVAGGVTGGMYRAKEAGAPIPSAPASEPSAAESYAASNDFRVNGASPSSNAETANAPSAANEATAKKDETTIAAAQKQAPPPPPAKAATSPSAGTFASLAAPERNVDQLALVAAPLWRVRSGRLQHSTGSAWQALDVESGARFTAVFALGQDVWAGAQNLIVYHSNDDGQHWSKSQLQPALNNVKNGRITKIEFSDAQHGQLFVRGEAPDDSRAEDLWTSNDGGKTWIYETID